MIRRMIRWIDAQLFVETLGIHRRAMSHDPGVRERLYRGLLSLFGTHNNLRPFIFDLLLPQFNKYYSLSPPHVSTYA
jgi:hypothetical protein